MSIRDYFSHTKTRFKRRFGISPGNLSSVSSPNLREPSPGPLTAQRAVTPQPKTVDSPEPAHSAPTTETLAPDSNPRVTLMATPNPVSSNPSAISHLPTLAPDDTQHNSDARLIDIQPNAGTTKSKSVARSVAKTVLKVVESSADAFGPLKSAVGGLNKCIDIIEQAAKGHKEYEELKVKLKSLRTELEAFLSGTKNPSITENVGGLAIAIDHEVSFIEGKLKRNALERHAEALEDVGEITECYRRIEGHIGRLALSANLSIWKTVSILDDVLLQQKLSPSLSALYDSALSGSGAVQRGECTPGTRIPEIERLLTWVEQPEGKNIFWMNGMAGTGKTTIAYSVCTELERQKALGASFFCSRLIPECRDVNAIIPAIAYQLARFSYPFRCALSEVLEDQSDVHARVLRRQFETLLAKPLSKIKDRLLADYVVVIDALDECDDKHVVEQILDILLPQTTESTLPVRFLISSRPEPEIHSRMMKRLGGALDSRLALHDLDAQLVRKDIGIYLQEELADVPLSPSQLEELADRSGVLFIFASTASRYIKDGLRFQEHEERLDAVLGLSVSPDGDQTHEIDRLYTTILEAALRGGGQSRSISDKMKNTLDAVICAQEPMTVGALVGLLGLKNTIQADALLRPLCSVLNISESDGLVTTLHASFPDYMLDQKRSQLLWCNPAINHPRLAQACFKAINSSGQPFNICALESSYVADSEVEGLAERAKQTIPTELFYACRFWISHTEAYESRELEQPLFNFLSNRTMLWMEVLNLKNCMNLGPGIMRRAEDWSRVSKCEAKTTELAHDAWRFVSMFAGHAVSKSTAHIYISMLPFWPEDTPVSRHYGRRANTTKGVQGTAMTRRQLTNLATWNFKDSVMVARFSPDSSLIAYSNASIIYLIGGSTGSAVLGPLAHDNTVLSVGFSPDGTLLASGSEDRSVRVWNTSTGEAVVDPMTEHTNRITSVCFTPDGTRVVSGSYDTTIRVWNWRTNTALSPFKGHTDWVRSVCLSPDGTRIVSGSDDRTVRIWDIESGQMAFESLVGHASYVRSVCFSPDGSRIVSGSNDGTIRTWSAQTGQQLGEPFKGHTDYVTSVAFSPDGSQLASGSEDNTIRLWNTDGTLKSVQQFDGHTHYVNSVAFSSDGTRILSCSNDKTIRVWDARSKAVVDTPLEAHTQSVSSVCFSHDGTRILSASSDATVRVWDARSGSPLLKPLTGQNQNNCARFSPDGTRIAAGSADHTIQLWNSETGQPAGEPLTGHSDDVVALCFSPDGALVASGSEDTTIRVWSTQTGKAATDPLAGHTNRVRSVCFSPDGTRLVSGSGDKTVRVWKVKTGKLALDPLEGHTDWVWSVCFSPDGTRIASASSDASIRLWDSSTGETGYNPLKGHTSEVLSVCFSPTGDFIASSSTDRTIRLWGAHTGAAIGVLLTGHTSWVWSVAFSPDGSQIVSGSQDATIRVFEVSDLSTLRSKAGPSSPSDKDPDALTFACQPWVLQDDGWMVDAQSRLLAWVPLDLHARLLRPRNTLLISATGFVKVELDHDKLGEGWARCYKP